MFAYFIRCCTTDYAQFAGRARRKEYWSFALFCTIAMLLMLFISSFLLTIFTGYIIDETNVDILIDILFAIFIVPGTAVTVRRFHDMNISGWWALLYLSANICELFDSIYLIGLVIEILIMILCCFKGTAGSNQFGSDPLAKETQD